MPRRVEGPDQEELECVSTGDTGGSSMTLRNGGNPIPVTATSDEDYMAGQHAACGDGPFNPKTTCSGMSEEKAPEQEAEKKAVQSKKDEDNGQRSACAPREDLKLNKEQKPAPAVDEGDVYIHAQSAETCTELSPAAATSITEGECHARDAANCEGDHDLHGQRRSRSGKRRTRSGKTKRRKSGSEYAHNRTYTAERHTLKLVLAVLLSSLTWTAVMGSKEVKMATVSCSLSAAIPFIIVKYFRNDSNTEMVMHCGENYKPDCHSDYNCVMEIWDDRVVSFKCPEAMLKTGTFKLQSQEKDRFIPCHNSTVDNSTATGAGQNSPTAGQNSPTALIVIVVVVIIIVAVIIVAVIVCKCCNNRPGKDGCMKVRWCLLNRSKKEPATPEEEPVNDTSV